MCYLDVTTRHVKSAVDVEEHLLTTSGSEWMDQDSLLVSGRPNQISSQKDWRLMETESPF